MDPRSNFISSSIAVGKYYRELGLRAIEQLSESELHIVSGDGITSIAILVQHIYGNAKSRWTDFLNSDGEKRDRNRDQEFVNQEWNKEQVILHWNNGWLFLIDAISSLNEEQLTQIILIRNQEHTVIEAIQRQIGHLSYHTGQVVILAKHILGDRWQSLTIPIGQSEEFSQNEFDKGRRRNPMFDKN